MVRQAGIEYRRAEGGDVQPLMWLYQLACADDPLAVPLLLDRKALVQALNSREMLWIVAERAGSLLASLSILVDGENRIAKLDRVLIHPEWAESLDVLTEALPLLIGYLGEKSVEILYTTTKGLTHTQQEVTLEKGFKLLGIFPNAVGSDPTGLNGLSAYFYPGVLGDRRQAAFPLHPDLKGIFEITRSQCLLPPLPILGTEAEKGAAPIAEKWKSSQSPQLELILAPRLVAHRFARLKERRSLSTSFYPFQSPNVLITDPAQRVEIFVRLAPDAHFAAIIGERLDLAVNPAALYTDVSGLLKARGVSYIEIINDATDAQGIQSILNAGYLPCAYFPSFHNSGDVRRDYVVFARFFERLPPMGSLGGKRNPVYGDYLNELYRSDLRD